MKILTDDKSVLALGDQSSGPAHVPSQGTRVKIHLCHFIVVFGDHTGSPNKTFVFWVYRSLLVELGGYSVQCQGWNPSLFQARQKTLFSVSLCCICFLSCKGACFCSGPGKGGLTHCSEA